MGAPAETLRTARKQQPEQKLNNGWIPVSEAFSTQRKDFDAAFAAMGGTTTVGRWDSTSLTTLPWGTQTVEQGGQTEVGYVKQSGIRIDPFGDVTLKLRDTDIPLTHGAARLLTDKQGETRGVEFIPSQADTNSFPRVVTITGKEFHQEGKNKPEKIIDITEKRILPHETLTDGDQGIVWMSQMKH